MLDNFGRDIDYLRLSVTSGCNLRCLYCVAPETPFPVSQSTPETSPMTPADIGRLCVVMGRLGIHKVRITGGEPLLRRDLEAIVDRIAHVPEIAEIALTTNGMGLEQRTQSLKDAGLRRINISLDSLEARNYARITRGGDWSQVWAGVGAALEAGFLSVRLNVVVMKGINDHEIGDFLEVTRDRPVDVRFIELMPIGGFRREHKAKLVLNTTILNTHPDLRPCPGQSGREPALYYRLPGYRGRIGLISPISHKFCAQCNRIRVTYDGKIKTCLGDNTETDVLTVLKNEPDRLEPLLHGIIQGKPAGHRFANGFDSERNMAAIGG